MKLLTYLAPRRVSLFFLVGSLVWLGGCSGGAKEKVTGKATVDGSVCQGTVVFVSPDGSKQVEGPINPQGEYTVLRPPKGKCKVYIKAPLGAGGAPGGGAPMTPKMSGMTLQDPGVPPPAKYQKPETSGLEFEVTGGTQTFPIEMTNKP